MGFLIPENHSIGGNYNFCITQLNMYYHTRNIHALGHYSHTKVNHKVTNVY